MEFTFRVFEKHYQLNSKYTFITYALLEKPIKIIILYLLLYIILIIISINN